MFRAYLGESSHESERPLSNRAPAAVDRQRVPPVRDLLDFGHGRVLPLLLVGGVRNRPGDGVVVLAIDDQQRAAVGVLRIDLGLADWVHVCVFYMDPPAT